MALNLMIPMRLQDMAERELEAGERIEWIAQPAARFFTPKSVGLFLFSLPWTAFSLFWIGAASGFKIPNFSEGGFSLFPLFGVPFLLIGLGMMLTPLFEFLKARKTVYVVTNKRAIIFAGGRSTTIRSFLPEQLHNVTRREKANGTGDVVIGRHATNSCDGYMQVEEDAFLRIPNPQDVEKRLKKLAELDVKTE